MAEPNLQKGSTDPAVRDLQEALKALGYNPGPIDGVFGATTEAAAKAFQQARGITADGIVGKLTWINIDEADQSEPVARQVIYGVVEHLWEGTMVKLRSCIPYVTGAFVLGASLFGGCASAQSPCPNPPVPSITSPDVPRDVCVPSGFGDNPIRFFDDYSWRAFIAMVWPAANGKRGKPDANKRLADSGPRVFETFKSIWEIFHEDGSTPAPWNKYEVGQFNACNASLSFGELVLASFSKFSDLGQAGIGSLVGPLVAQNRTYTRYLTGFNEIEFDQMLKSKLFRRSQLPMKKPFQNGALDVKSAWILMTNIAHPNAITHDRLSS
jgi:hypothetical protein